MGTIECLVFQRRVPPHVDQDDVVTASQVETYAGLNRHLVWRGVNTSHTGATRLERDQNDLRPLAVLDLLQGLLPLVLIHGSIV